MDMDWSQTLTIIISMFGLFLVAIPFVIVRMDSHKKYLDQKQDSSQKENNTKFEQLLTRLDSKFDIINNRFNGIENRLTAIESEIKNNNQRVTDMGQKLDQRITDLKTDMNQRLSTIENFLLPRKVLPFEDYHHKGNHEEPKEN